MKKPPTSPIRDRVLRRFRDDPEFAAELVKVTIMSALQDKLAELSPERRAAVMVRANELIAEELDQKNK